MRYHSEKTDDQHAVVLHGDVKWTNRKDGVKMPIRGGAPSPGDMIFWDLIRIPGLLEVVAYPDRLNLKKAMVYDWIDILWGVDECLEKHFRKPEKDKPDPE